MPTEDDEYSLLGIASDPGGTIDALGQLLAQHKLVPFVGAGASRQHVGFAGRELAQEMARLLGRPSETLLSSLADDYVDAYGGDAFADFLRTKMTVAELDESKVPIHRLILSMSPRVVYTTNQDNLFELTAQHYGRPYRRVVTLQDLSDAVPDDRLLMKFHGDPDTPSSLVFSATSYKHRMAAERHPFDIRLESDLLGKQLLFIGYSLQDENVNKLLAAVKKVFGGNMPKSYLLAFEYDQSMNELSSSYGVQVINPSSFLSEPATPAIAFERLLKAICDATIKYQTKQGLAMLLGGGKNNPRMVTEFELDALEKIVDAGPFDVAVSAFRGLLDHTRIPTSMSDRCTDIFRRVVESASPSSEDEMNALQPMLFNFRPALVPATCAMAYVMAACNKRPRVQGFDRYSALMSPAVPSVCRPVAAALAVTVLRDRQEAITDQFRYLADYWFEGFDGLSEPLLGQVKAAIDIAWSGRLATGSPLNRPRRPLSMKKDFHSIMEEMVANWPKQFRAPEA